MEVYKDVPKNFLAKYERHEPVALDNAALSMYKVCPRKYFFRFVLAFEPNGDTPPYFTLGSSYHKYREVFELVWKKESDLTFQDRFDLSDAMAKIEAFKYWDKKTNSKIVLAPNTKWDWITRPRLEKSLEVTANWLNIEKKNGNIIVIATEQPFIVEAVSGVFWGGRADQVVRWNNRLWGRDFKTSSKKSDYFKRLLKPSNQFLGYTIGEELLHGSTVDGQLVEVLFNSKTDGPKIVPYPTSFNVFEKGLWKKELTEWTDRLQKSRELDLYPANESHCPFCPYHQVCTNTSESGMAATLESKYKVSPWDFMNPDNEDMEAA